jgi:hypothetical protein
MLLSDLTEQEIRRYMKVRKSEGVNGRTFNAEIGELSRAIGKPWSILWPRVRKMEERRDVGRALSPEEEQAGHYGRTSKNGVRDWPSDPGERRTTLDSGSPRSMVH